MTNEEREKEIRKLPIPTKEECIAFYKDLVKLADVRFVPYYKMAIMALEQTDKIENSNFSTEQYKADLQGAYDCGYNSGYTDAMNDIAESEEEK